MTNKEAIKVLDSYDGSFIGYSSDDVEEALRLAKKALKDRPTGMWERNGYGHLVCGHCRAVQVLTYRSMYCPDCGARMNRGERNDK